MSVWHWRFLPSTPWRLICIVHQSVRAYVVSTACSGCCRGRNWCRSGADNGAIDRQNIVSLWSINSAHSYLVALSGPQGADGMLGAEKDFLRFQSISLLDRPSPSAPEVESNTRCIGVSRTISAIGIMCGAVRLDLCFKTRAASAHLNPARIIGTEGMLPYASYETNCRVWDLAATRNIYAVEAIDRQRVGSFTIAVSTHNNVIAFSSFDIESDFFLPSADTISESNVIKRIINIWAVDVEHGVETGTAGTDLDRFCRVWTENVPLITWTGSPQTWQTNCWASHQAATSNRNSCSIHNGAADRQNIVSLGSKSTHPNFVAHSRPRAGRGKWMAGEKKTCWLMNESYATILVILISHYIIYIHEKCPLIASMGINKFSNQFLMVSKNRFWGLREIVIFPGPKAAVFHVMVIQLEVINGLTSKALEWLTVRKIRWWIGCLVGWRIGWLLQCFVAWLFGGWHGCAMSTIHRNSPMPKASIA